MDERVEKLAKLADDWDGYGAPPIDKGCIMAAESFLDCVSDGIRQRATVAPESDGSVLIVFDLLGRRCELFIESLGE